MACTRSRQHVNALYSVFILPFTTNATSATTTLARALPRPHQPIPQPIRPSPHRLFSTTPSLTALANRRTSVPETDGQKWDDDITAPMIILIDPETNRLSEEPTTRRDVMVRMNRSTHRLLQVSEQSVEDAFGATAYPVCRVVDRKEYYEQGKRKKAQRKEAQREQKLTSVVKTMELNWAIEKGDLGHRLGKIVEFLQEGRRVEVVLAAKKRGRRASPEECEAVLKRIATAVDVVKGAKELGNEGKIGGVYTLTYQGRPLSS